MRTLIRFLALCATLFTLTPALAEDVVTSLRKAIDERLDSEKLATMSPEEIVRLVDNETKLAENFGDLTLAYCTNHNDGECLDRQAFQMEWLARLHTVANIAATKYIQREAPKNVASLAVPATTPAVADPPKPAVATATATTGFTDKQVEKLFTSCLQNPDMAEKMYLAGDNLVRGLHPPTKEQIALVAETANRRLSNDLGEACGITVYFMAKAAVWTNASEHWRQNMMSYVSSTPTP